MQAEAAEIAAFIAKRGVRLCPPKAAAVLGESTPGWRRNAERRAERAPSVKPRRRIQHALKRRLLG